MQKCFKISVGFGINEMPLLIDEKDENLYNVIFNGIPLCEIARNKEADGWERVVDSRRVNPLLLVDLQDDTENKYKIMIDEHTINCIGEEIQEYQRFKDEEWRHFK